MGAEGAGDGAWDGDSRSTGGGGAIMGIMGGADAGRNASTASPSPSGAAVGSANGESARASSGAWKDGCRDGLGDVGRDVLATAAPPSRSSEPRLVTALKGSKIIRSSSTEAAACTKLATTMACSPVMTTAVVMAAATTAISHAAITIPRLDQQHRRRSAP